MILSMDNKYVGGSSLDSFYDTAKEEGMATIKDKRHSYHQDKKRK